jgi:hypothetical protein
MNMTVPEVDLQLAADQGNTAAQFHYRLCLRNVERVSIDLKGAGHYVKLADQGHAPAQNNYGLCLNKGQGIPRDFKEAADHLKLAIDQGHTLECQNIRHFSNLTPRSDARTTPSPQPG